MMQDKGALCACGCGQRKTNRKRRYFPGHPRCLKVRAFSTTTLRDKSERGFYQVLKAPVTSR
jgi:hypothetical protein